VYKRQPYTSLLQGVTGKIAAIGFATVTSLIGSPTYAASDLSLKYVQHHAKKALRVDVRSKDTYFSLAQLYTGSYANAAAVQQENAYAPLREGDVAYIPAELVDSALESVLKKNLFEVIGVDPDEEGADNVYSIAHSLCPEKTDELINIILSINKDINPSDKIVHPEQDILVPKGYCDTEAVKRGDLAIIKPSQEKRIRKITPSLYEQYARFQSPIQGVSMQKNYTQLHDGGKNDFDSYFGSRNHGHHKGFDSFGPLGAKIYSVAIGTVIKVKQFPSGKGYFGKDCNDIGRTCKNGNLVSILMPNGIAATYAHLGSTKVKEHQIVDKSTVIGTMGITGNAWHGSKLKKYGPHVHIGFRKGSAMMNKEGYFKPGASMYSDLPKTNLDDFRSLVSMIESRKGVVVASKTSKKK